MENNFLCKDISEINLEHSYFHYTNKQNLYTIFKNGLEPRIGENSLYVEKTPKVFFVEGEKGIITIMDVWLKWLTSKSSCNKFIYWFGTMYMRIPFCIKCIPNYIVKRNLKDNELEELWSKFLTTNYSKMSRSNPRVFTEQGVMMLATILKSEVAIEVSISIMDTFVKLRRYISR